MDKKLTKKQIIIIIVVAAIAIIIANILIGKGLDKASKYFQEDTAETTTETAEEAGEAKTADATITETEEEDEPTRAEELGVTQEEYDAYVDSGNAFFPEGTTGEVNVYDKDGLQQTTIGNYTVTYDGSYASNGDISFSYEDLSIDMLVYDDGDKNDTKAFFMAYPVMGNKFRPESIDAAKAVVTELVTEGAGTTSEWEETNNFFIRKYSGYDSNDLAAVIYYTLVPKKMTDENIYQIIFAASKAGTTITPVSEDSYNSIMDAVKEDVKDSKLIHLNYDALKADLNDIAFYESADNTDSSLKALQDAYKTYLIDTYGTTDIDSLTEEEKELAEWKATDYEGYKEYMLYEKGVDITTGEKVGTPKNDKDKIDVIN